MKFCAQGALLTLTMALAVLAGCTSVHSDNEPMQAVSAGDGRPFGGAPAVDIPPS